MRQYSETDNDMHKTSGYVRTVVALHDARDRAKEAIESLQEKSLPERVREAWGGTRRAVSSGTRNFFTHPENVPCEHIPQEFGYMFRPKSRWELVLLSGTVCGIEFCYAAETAFVTPILLGLGLGIRFVTMIWCLSPLIGFFLTPVLGSLSDSCESKFGRRRPFILLLSIGILVGLVLVPNGRHIGIALGDIPNLRIAPNVSELSNGTSVIEFENFVPLYLANADGSPRTPNLSEFSKGIDVSSVTEVENGVPLYLVNTDRSPLTPDAKRNGDTMHKLGARSIVAANLSQLANETLSKRFSGEGAAKIPPRSTTGIRLQPWSIAFTVMGTVLLDFCSDACQSPSRTYLLDVSLHEDHNAGLSTFTMMAGLGGSVGYLMGAVHWEATLWGRLLGGQVNVVFALVAVIFVICLVATLSSFPEMPLPLLKDPNVYREYQQKLHVGEFQERGSELEVIESRGSNYGTTASKEEAEDAKSTPNGMANGISEIAERPISEQDKANDPSVIPTVPSTPTPKGDQPVLKEYLRSIVHMPRSLQVLCLTNLFCWMSLVCYSLYFTDFVGEVVFGGDPQAPEGSHLHELFKDGVSFGCWGMALYSISCSVYSYFIERLVKRLGAKPVYIGGQLVYSVGMIIMAVARHPVAVILLSPTAGVMYSTLFTMPYLLIAHYHCMQKFRDDKSGGECGIRGIGTDVASVSSMVFLSQFILSLTMGSIVEAVGSNVATVCAAAVLSACGAISATQVMYLDI